MSWARLHVVAVAAAVTAAATAAFLGASPAAAQTAPADERDAQMLAQWRLDPAQRSAEVMAFEKHLRSLGLQTEVPLHELLRSASSWKNCSAEPFAVPPAERWVWVAQVLKLLRELRQRGVLAQVEVHSAYRDEALNTCAGGAAGSAHLKHFAIDFTPADPQAAAIALCAFWSSEGEAWQMGLGRYESGRLHIDTMRYRSWGVGC